MKLYLDDERTTPEGWRRFYTSEDIIKYLNDNRYLQNIQAISLDHDLGWANTDGYAVVKWIEEEVYINNYNPPNEIIIHSANSSARQKMELGIESIKKYTDLKYKILEILTFVGCYNGRNNPFDVTLDYVDKSFTFYNYHDANSEETSKLHTYFGNLVIVSGMNNPRLRITKVSNFDKEIIDLSYSLIKL